MLLGTLGDAVKRIALNLAWFNIEHLVIAIHFKTAILYRRQCNGLKDLDVFLLNGL